MWCQLFDTQLFKNLPNLKCQPIGPFVLKYVLDFAFKSRAQTPLIQKSMPSNEYTINTKCIFKMF